MPVDISPDVKVSFNEQRLPRKRRVMYRQLPFGAVPGFAPICCDSNDPMTQLKGISQRLGRKLPEINKETLNEFDKFVSDELPKMFTPLSSVMSFEEWLKETSYPEWRKTELRTVHQRYQGTCPRKLRRKVASFQKTENYETFKLPRGINSRHDAFKCVAGPAFKSIENVVYKHPSFIKHVPVSERPARIAKLARSGARYFGTDYSSFEASHVPKLMDACELKLYAYMLQNFPELSNTICSTIKGTNHGYMRASGVGYTLRGRRMSGDMCTSLGNGFVNLMVFKFLMRDRKADILVEGDDGIAAVYDDGPLPVPSDYEKLGFYIKIEATDHPCHASFCGVISEDNIGMKDPAALLANFGWTHSCIQAGDQVAMELLRAKCLSLAYEHPSSPISRALADAGLRFTRGLKARFVRDGWHEEYPNDETQIPPCIITDKARMFYETRFGITLARQIECEERLRAGEDSAILAEYFTAPKDQQTDRKSVV